MRFVECVILETAMIGVGFITAKARNGVIKSHTVSRRIYGTTLSTGTHFFHSACDPSSRRHPLHSLGGGEGRHWSGRRDAARRRATRAILAAGECVE